MSDSFINVTDTAQEYLLDLLSKQDNEGMGVRIFVERPGTPHAECCMAYCAHGEEEPTDTKLELKGFNAFIDAESVPFLEDAVIDYAKDRMGGQLTFRAPKSKVPQIDENASVEQKVNYILYSEINPQLASHGGNVQLVGLVDDDSVAVLKFGGGCQGCGMVDVTLKEGIEKTLLEKVPQLKRVTDETDHSVTENAYFK
ncbi:MAG: Fe/S biogenesis protein NfuA [Pseudomonadales bacterium]|jgi:Fe/S biogenesis protein NfuA|uniref:Fe-S biogenesis protein NfuA n=1 Tax=unclassified Ketobacter TaxID=2639109 RepID=UPI000C4F3C84|nr:MULTISPECIES: Fe-S biogenesis protein NfuA [unclassified Ketobacter]MAQ26713.1 Fe/S biogenesis protein NfuA [Pseudomonadales bacterium]MEC8810018.1 Fe-S biogenesis protein NfuA [Pseudomonadota bacterium]TNC88690.1 MAG: Fe/S biogenesis protein NfuA [Alcanivorax sp.]HAG93210.1 Fe/S biogenesis protein NfuA [Gammaproteobacteria bacterium]MBI28195.1 Fe/S biogenesis protein NfuA [Pseudomonadales bacterium]|tara:strand:+ start:378 stop:974 length:597 start_codon:yes stop_codon:yes gene_type:complete